MLVGGCCELKAGEGALWYSLSDWRIIVAMTEPRDVGSPDLTVGYFTRIGHADRATLSAEWKFIELRLSMTAWL